MRILHCCDWFKEYTGNIVLATSKENHHISLIARGQTLEFQGRRDDELELHRRLDLHCEHLCVLPGSRYSAKSLVLILRGFFGRKSLARHDVLHLQHTHDPRFLWLSWRLPTVLTVHEPRPRTGLPREHGLRGVARELIRRAYRSSADLIVVHTVSGMQGLGPREARKAVIIPHGCDERTDHGPNSPESVDSTTILFFGRVAAYKGIETLLSAMQHVWKERPDARLRILANPGDGIDSHYSAGLDSRVRASWGGYSKRDLHQALSEARAVCMPYLSVSGSGVGAQALGWGRPIVASNLAGLRELASHEDLLFEPGNTKDLARALLAVLRNNYEPRRLDPRNTWPAVAEAHIAAYESVVEPRSGRGRSVARRRFTRGPKSPTGG